MVPRDKDKKTYSILKGLRSDGWRVDADDVTGIELNDLVLRERQNLTKAGRGAINRAYLSFMMMHFRFISNHLSSCQHGTILWRSLLYQC